MKYLSIALNVALLIAVAVLYYLHFNNKQETISDTPRVSGEMKDVAIAYINSDSLLNNYEFFKEMEDELDKKRARLERDYENRARGLQSEVENFQRTAGNMTMNQARAVEEDLMKKRQNLMQYQENLSQQLMQDQAKLNDSLYQKVSTYLKDFGSRNNLQLVLTYQRGSGVLYASDSLNITNEVIEGLNSVYKNGGATPEEAKSDTTAKN